LKNQLRNYREALERKVEELRKSQEELEASRNKYAFLYDFAPVGYFSLDRSGLIKTVNKTGLAMVGGMNVELVGRHFEELISLEDRLMFSKFIDKVFSSGVKETCRLKLLAYSQRELHVRIEAMATESADECLAVLVDITERRQDELALAESKYNLAKAQSMTRVGSWSFDPKSLEIKASDELLDIMQLSREQTTQEAFASVIHPDDSPTVLEHLRLGIEHGKSYEIEHRLLFGDGVTKWVYSIVEPSVNSLGEVVKIYGTTQDITERKRAEVELNNKTNELQAIFDSIGDGIVVYDHNGMVQHHNKIAPHLFPEEIFTGASCRAVFHPDMPTMINECPVARANRGERVDTSLVCIRDGGKTLYLDVTATPIKNEAGENCRALVFLRDISKKRLQEMHLIQAEKMSSLGILATGVAHEINNPIASVAGYAEALLRRLRDAHELTGHAELDVFPHYLGVIVREAYRCKAVIDQLLAFGRKSEGVAKDVDLNELLVDITDLLRHHPSYRQVNLVSNLSSDLPHILADPSSLRQVFMNLIINAFQAIEEDGRVELSTGLYGDGHVCVKVSDNGPGIGPDAIDRIWDPFYTTKEVGQGVGLGLALTYDIVKRHGGTIAVTSRPREGAQFTVLLPLRPE